MYNTLKRFGVLRWAGEDGENIVCTFGKLLAMYVLVNIAIQMVCLWPVGILNLVGQNVKKYWLTSDFFTILTHSTLNRAVQIHVPCTHTCEVISLKFMDNFIITVGGQLLALHCVSSVQCKSSISSRSYW